MTTQSELIELSKAAAKVAGISACKDDAAHGTSLWLHEDRARCFELMCQFGVNPQFAPMNGPNRVVMYGDGITEMFTDYAGNREQATRVAILKAIIAIGEQK